MRSLSTAGGGVIDPETTFSFSQVGDTISARYAGGTIRLGFLVGSRHGDRLGWRYVQIDNHGRLDSAHALCELSRLADVRLRLVEHFSWDSREGSRSNVLEQTSGG
jgi:hypothetical protein